MAKADFQKMYLQFIIFRLKEDEDYEIKIKNMSLSEINDNLQNMGWIREDFETNGWQQDTWMTYSHKGYSFEIVVAYSGYYGDIYLRRKEEN